MEESIQALTFDVFGTVVDWRGSIIREGEQLNTKQGLHVDWAAFADAWRGRYRPSMNRVRTGELPWTNLDALHRMALDELLREFKIDGLTEPEKVQLNRVWHRLSPWPDSADGLRRLKAKYTIATLSNGNVGLLVDMAKFGGLPWDTVLSAELAKAYKPDREVYLMAADLLGLQPSQVMMTAAHGDDLRAARSFGLATAYVPRPLERGPNSGFEPEANPDFDVVASDFLELATKLGA